MSIDRPIWQSISKIGPGAVVVVFAAVSATPVEAQVDSSLFAAAAVITPEAIARHIGIIAHDSMQGRDTPSRGLMLTAHYLADQFSQIGLTPGGDKEFSSRRTAPDNPWFARYPIPGKQPLDYAATTLEFRTRAKLPPVKGRPWALSDMLKPDVAVNFDVTARFAGDTIPASGARDFGAIGGWENLASQASVVMAGPHTAASVRQAALRRRVIFYIPSPSTDSATQHQVIDLLRADNRVVVLADEDSVTFAARRNTAMRKPVVVMDQFMEDAVGPHGWAAYVWPPAIRSFLDDAGLDLVQARAATTPVMRELPVTSVLLVPKIGKVNPDTATAVNVVGILEGQTPKYIVITAHMDQCGVTPGQVDSVCHGADDNASGVAGLIELAKAFSQPGVRPRLGIIFVGLSGSAGKDFWGATHWIQSRGYKSRVGVVNINLDMIGREAGDSIRVDGLRDLELPMQPAWVIAAHPELKLTMVDGGSVINAKSDHWAFVRHALLPALYFYSGSHDAPRSGDLPASIDAEQEARILRLIFYIVHDLAQAEELPRWTVESRQRLLDAANP